MCYSGLAMGVVTKTGDGGTTARFGGGRVPKHHASVAANGEVDELNSGIGILATHQLPPEIAADLAAIQKCCFTLGGQLATPADAAPEALGYIPRIAESDIIRLEERINVMEPTLAPQRKFILPGGSPSAACAFWVRTLARRAERAATAFRETAELDPLVIRYLNRLSDYFYIAGRFLNAQSGMGEIEWEGGTPPEAPYGGAKGGYPQGA